MNFFSSCPLQENHVWVGEWVSICSKRRVPFFRIFPSSPTTTCHLPRNLRRHHALEPKEKKKEEKEVEQLFFSKRGKSRVGHSLTTKEEEEEEGWRGMP